MRILYMSIGLCLLATAARAQGPTLGWTPYTDTFYVQKPYNLPVEDRYTFADGVHTCRIMPGDKPFNQDTDTGPRTEMRWKDWSNQSIEHMFEADVMYEPGTNRTCIMQVKSNTAGEAVYMQVHTDGDLRHSTGTPFLRGYWGRWFNLKVSYHPGTKVGRVWIDDVPKLTVSHKGGGGWYFKNGTYNNGMTGGTGSKAHFRNFRFWTRGGPLAIRPLPPPPATEAIRIFRDVDMNGRRLTLVPVRIVP